ncbi:uncharacterized protein OCT59_025072 [Rhizophagus irregularis]|uniref:uncharacterized protein n=1 Tax=Rhizophagus irregularis TaxID=588596 RepID=UPI00332E2630|nr:hypothetical protein OCT59_025072 [Rhizophagus irregularis]
MERIPPILESDNKEIILDEYIFYSNDGKRGCMGEIGRIAITQKRKWTFDNEASTGPRTIYIKVGFEFA